jgi:hypothetical protein
MSDEKKSNVFSLVSKKEEEPTTATAVQLFEALLKQDEEEDKIKHAVVIGVTENNMLVMATNVDGVALVNMMLDMTKQRLLGD